MYAAERIKALRDAIEEEEKAYEMYKSILPLLNEHRSIEICEEMMREELRHKQMLTELSFGDLSSFSRKIEQLGGHKLGVIEPLSCPIENTEIEALFEFAQRKEIESVKRYEMFSKAATGELKQLFLDLADEERAHVQMITLEIEKYNQAKKRC